MARLSLTTWRHFLALYGEREARRRLRWCCRKPVADAMAMHSGRPDPLAGLQAIIQQSVYSPAGARQHYRRMIRTMLVAMRARRLTSGEAIVQ